MDVFPEQVSGYPGRKDRTTLSARTAIGAPTTSFDGLAVGVWRTDASDATVLLRLGDCRGHCLGNRLQQQHGTAERQYSVHTGAGSIRLLRASVRRARLSRGRR